MLAAPRLSQDLDEFTDHLLEAFTADLDTGSGNANVGRLLVKTIARLHAWLSDPGAYEKLEPVEWPSLELPEQIADQ